MDAGAEQRSSPSSSTSSPPTPTKRPAGRTKFTETRHPVYRGVRQRGGAGRWVCEVRVPGQRGERLWLGTYVTAEEAARAHDAAMLALLGRSAASACLNFADSEWLLVVPPSLSDFADVRRAAVEAVEDFQRKQAKDGGGSAFPVDEVTSTVSLPSCADDAAGSSAPPQPSADGASEVPAALGNDMFELHMSGEVGLGTYYADLAEGLLLDPPQPSATGARSENGDCGDDDGADDAVLWSY